MSLTSKLSAAVRMSWLERTNGGGGGKTGWSACNEEDFTAGEPSTTDLPTVMPFCCCTIVLADSRLLTRTIASAIGSRSAGPGVRLDKLGAPWERATIMMVKPKAMRARVNTRVRDRPVNQRM